MDEPIIISTTVERQEHAEDLARLLLQKKLVACAQINGPTQSLYWWKDEIVEAVEFTLTVKTFLDFYLEIELIILKNHPYDVPEIVAQPLVRISESYLLWMQKELDQ